MTHTYDGLALTYPAAAHLETLLVPLDDDVRKSLHAHLQTMAFIVEQTKAAQDAVSNIYANTLMVADASVATLAYIRATRHPSVAMAELDEFDRIQSTLLLETLKQLARAGSHTVLADTFST